MSEAEATRRTAIGVGLATGVILLWAAIHVSGVFFIAFEGPILVAVPFLILLQTWLSVGLFIISHDAIHGSLAPMRPGVNKAFGWIAMTLYAGFDYGRLKENHDAHHRAPGTAADPDFSAEHPTRFFDWAKAFFGRHFGWRPLIFVNTVVAVYWLVIGAPMANIFLFYGLPALASAVQLFYFSTYRPHRHAEDVFADGHNTRSDRMPTPLATLTCYNFGGFHHEHHLFPHEPWWRLPALRLPEASLPGARLPEERPA